MYTEVNVVDVVLFTRSRANDAATFTLEIPKTLKKREQHFQYVAYKLMNDKNSDFFAAHFAKCFTQNPSPQQCREIISLEILSPVNFIGSMNIWR